MKNDFENQINEIHAELDKFKCKLKFFRSFFTTSIVPKPQELEQEQKLTEKLIKYDLSALIFVANEVESKHKTIANKVKNTGLELLRHVGLIPLIIILIFAIPILYHNYFGLSVYSLIALWGLTLFAAFFAIGEMFVFASKYKDEKCMHLIREAATLKERNMSDEELQQSFKQVRAIMAIVRSRKIKKDLFS